MIKGGCYCGAVRYEAAEPILFRGQCHCRECQYISGGSANVVVGLGADGFSFSKGEPAAYTRPDLPHPVTRKFCATCGTHLLTESPGLTGVKIVKVGTLDNPEIFGQPERVIWTCEKQSFHHIPEGVPAYEKFPPRAGE